MPLSPPEPAPAPARRRPRSPWSRGSQSDRRSIQIGLAGTLLVHILLLWLGPKFESRFLAADATYADNSADASQTFEIEIMPEEEPQPEPPPPQEFVEANPDAPDNPPDETDHFSNRNQQLAQETPDPENQGDMPSTEGMDDIDSTAIVTGTRSPAMDPVDVPPAPETEVPPNEFTEPAAAPRLAQDPISGIEEFEGDDSEGVGSNIVKLPENPQTDVTEQVEGVHDPELARPEGQGLYFRPDPSRPQQRPQLVSSQIRSAVLANRVNGTANMGVKAHSALRTAYGDYLARIIDVVDAEWNGALLERNSRGFAFPAPGSKVEVSFFLDKDGKVTISKVDGNAGQMWDGVTVEAIARPARQSEGYGKWSDDMIAILGDRTEITFTFHYL